jgi:hypothetical protein
MGEICEHTIIHLLPLFCSRPFVVELRDTLHLTDHARLDMVCRPVAYAKGAVRLCSEPDIRPKITRWGLP